MLLMQVLGTPTREEIKCMNPNYTEFKFPQIKAHPWHKVLGISHVVYLVPRKLHVNILFYIIDHQIFHKRMPPEAVDLVSRLLQYSPNLRSTAVSTFDHICSYGQSLHWSLITWGLSLSKKKRKEKRKDIITMALCLAGQVFLLCYILILRNAHWFYVACALSCGVYRSLFICPVYGYESSHTWRSMCLRDW